MTRSPVGLVALLLLASGACRREAVVAQSGPTVLARAGAEVLTAPEFEAEAGRRGVGKDQVARRALLAEMTERLRLLAYARTQGLDRDPELRREIDAILVAKAREALGASAEAVVKPPTEDELQSAYNARRHTFTTPASVHVAMIHHTDRAEVEAARTGASALPAGRRDFGELAVTHSDDQATRYVGGDFGELVAGHCEGVLPPEAIEACFALEAPGDVSPVIASKDGWRIFRLMAKTPAAPLPFSKVRSRLLSELVTERRREAEDAAARRIAALPGESHPDLLK